MHELLSAISAFTAILPHAESIALRMGAERIRAAIPPGHPDLEAVADGLSALLLIYGDSLDRELLIAQLDGEITGLTLLASEAMSRAETPKPALPRASPPPAAPQAAAPRPAPRPQGLPEWVDAGMLSEFLESLRSGLGEVEGVLLAGTFGEAERARVARILHTMKGESSTVGFSALEELFHALEDRIGAIGLQDAMDETLEVKDWILEAVPMLAAGLPEPDGRENLLRTLRASGRQDPKTLPPPPPSTNLPSDPEMMALFVEFYDEASESLVQADELLVSIEGGTVDAGTVDALFRVFHTIKGLAGFLGLAAIGALSHAAETLLDDARQDLASLAEDRIDLLLRATQMVRKLLEATRHATETGSAEAVKVDGFDVLHQRLLDARRGPVGGGAKPAAVAAAPREREREEEPEEAPTRGPTLIRETIKVDLARVDNLVETIGELVIIEAMVTNAGDLRHVSQRTRHQLAQLSKIVRDLQRQGLALRMVPLRGVFQKMSRLVRDLARRSGKPINLELSGQDAEMDRSLAERMGDPLVHMVRNAVDHGIEPLETRRAAGKPDTATIRLRAFHEGGNIIVELSDDGGGLNRAKILAKAKDRGIIPHDAELSDREIWELIFEPGFSTASQLTELSGRGVGMDVVKRTIEEMRGRVQIHSEEGVGTRFRLVLPLTLAIIEGMLLVVGERRYVLPTLSILESLKPNPGQIHRFAGGGRVLDMRGEQLPLVDLSSLLCVDSPASWDPTAGFIVVVDGLTGRFGLIVDDLIGQQQVVIKHIDPAVNGYGLFSGAAILSDGHVGLILNPAALRADEQISRRVEAG